MQLAGPIQTIIEEVQRKIIPAKFGQNPASSCLKQLLTVLRTTNNGHPMITIANLEPMAQVR